MKNCRTAGEQRPDLPLIFSFSIALLFVPVTAHAVQVGCFFTALFIGTMFLLGFGLTIVVKHLLAKYVWKLEKTSWKRLFALTWLELFLIIAVFASTRTNILTTLLVYLPFGILLNMALLKKVSSAGTTPLPVPVKKRYACCVVLPLALPASLQFAMMLATLITKLITFTDLQL